MFERTQYDSLRENLSKDFIKDKLQTLVDIEKTDRGDAFRLVAYYVLEYKKSIGNDDWIIKFVSDYTEMRRKKEDGN